MGLLQRPLTSLQEGKSSGLSDIPSMTCRWAHRQSLRCGGPAGGRQRYFARQRPDRGPDAADSLSSVQKFAVLAPDFPPAANILNQGCMARASTLVRPLLGWALLAWGCSWCPLGFDANAAFKTPLFQCKHWRWQMLSLICKKCSWCYVKTYARESILKMVQGPVSYES